MTIEIEAGASQGQFSMKPLGSARVFRRPALEPQDIPRPMQIWRSRPFEKKPIRFPKRDTIP